MVLQTHLELSRKKKVLTHFDKVNPSYDDSTIVLTKSNKNNQPKAISILYIAKAG